MPSKKIYDKRHERRSLKESIKKNNIINEYDNLSKLIDFNNLVNGFISSKTNVSWKPSIQKYEFNLFKNTYSLIKFILRCSDDPVIFNKFLTSEIGKIREIQSVNIKERVNQHTLCDNILYPYITHSFIYDNSASQINKGTDLAIRRVKLFLHKFYRYYGDNDGYILQMDFSGYFKNIDHEEVRYIIHKLFRTKEIIINIMRVIDSFDNGIGLGSQICQIVALAYCNDIDHYIKEVLKVKYYHRYMDDSIFILRTYEECEQILNILKPLYSIKKIKLNESKTRIISLKSSKFVFLKKSFKLTKTGKVIVKDSKASCKRFKHKVRKLYELYSDNEITLQEVYNVLYSRRQSLSKYNTYKCIIKLDKYVYRYFSNLFKILT